MKTWEELQVLVRTVMDGYGERFDIRPSSDWYRLKLQEEFGELVQSYLVASGQTRKKETDSTVAKEKLADEFADVVSFLFLFAEHEGIDIREAIERKWGKHL